MNTVLTALLTQLKAYSDLSYAAQSAYIAEDSFALMELNRFPFYNIVPGDERIETGPNNMSSLDIERHIYPVTIQFATSSSRVNVAIMGDDANNIKGILQFSNDLWSGVKFDRTLNGTVQGVTPHLAIPKNFMKDASSDLFIAQAEMTIEFFKDVGLL
jgi:hypothetical protein